jgi:hypothetical protein
VEEKECDPRRGVDDDDCAVLRLRRRPLSLLCWPLLLLVPLLALLALLRDARDWDVSRMVSRSSITYAPVRAW